MAKAAYNILYTLRVCSECGRAAPDAPSDTAAADAAVVSERKVMG